MSSEWFNKGPLTRAQKKRLQEQLHNDNNSETPSQSLSDLVETSPPKRRKQPDSLKNQSTRAPEELSLRPELLSQWDHLQLTLHKNILDRIISETPKILKESDWNNYLSRIEHQISQKESQMPRRTSPGRQLSEEEELLSGSAELTHYIFRSLIGQINSHIKQRGVATVRRWMKTEQQGLAWYLDRLEELSKPTSAVGTEPTPSNLMPGSPPLSQEEPIKMEINPLRRVVKVRAPRKKVSIQLPEEDCGCQEDLSDVDEQGNIAGLIDYDYDKKFRRRKDRTTGDDKPEFRQEEPGATDTDEDWTSDTDSEEESEVEESLEFEEMLESGQYDELDIKYIRQKMDSHNNVAKRDINYFHHLPETEKKNTLDLFDKIKEINCMDKPYIFRAIESEMPLKVKAELVKKLEMAQNDSSDSFKLNSWIEGVLSIPFGTFRKEKVTKCSSPKRISQYLRHARQVLDQAVYGHKDAKNKVLQVVAQQISNPKSQGLVMGIRGPMGNGKTTLVEEGLSKVLNRSFSYIALGGASDSSFLDGHGYTYEGSIWGKIIDVVMKAKSMNPIIYFDELDKVSKTYKGDEIINVLMHLIDPAQNQHFQDKYFTGIDFDLSKVMFIFSYNDSDLIHPILKDRILEVNTKGFKTREKLVIAKQYMLPRIYRDIGLTQGIIWSEDVLEFMIDTYTDEGGVRKFKELLYEVAREINLRFLGRRPILGHPIHFPLEVTRELLTKDIFLKKYNIQQLKIHTQPQVGKVNGLYATSNDTGGLIIIEVMYLPTEIKLGLELTGQQGDVMKESMSVAKSVAWNIISAEVRAEIQANWKKYGNTGLHIHCPEGATPKDGPSAGAAITTAIISRLTHIPIRNDLAMTGEIDLSGGVLEIGGLEHKLQGAKKAGVQKVLCPKQNKQDLDRIRKENPKLLQDSNFRVTMVENIWEVLHYALVTGHQHDFEHHITTSQPFYRTSSDKTPPLPVNHSPLVKDI